jgi:hypothetical protein
MSNRVKLEFENALAKDDYGLIVGKDGTVKGIWIPDGEDQNVIPDNIAKLCIEHFHFDPNEKVTEVRVH